MNSEWTHLFVRSIGLLGIALLLDLSIRFFGYWIRKKQKDGWTWAFRKVVKAPFLLLIWGGAVFTLLIWFAQKQVLPLSLFILEAGRSVFFIVVAAWAITLLKNRFADQIQERIDAGRHPSLDKQLILTFNKMATIGIAIIAGLFLLDTMGMDLTAALAFGGIGGLAIGWAAKDVIANFFGGLMIFINRPFSEGDWIKSTNKQFEGVVESIGWYMTRIRTFERRPTYIPNALVTDAIIENPGRMYNRRIRQTVALRYQDFHLVEAVTEEIKQMLRKHPQVDTQQFLFAELVAFGEYALDIDVYCFTKCTKFADFRLVQQDIFLKIGEIIKNHGADFAFPTRLNYTRVLTT